jgi:hypothetical protein
MSYPKLILTIYLLMASSLVEKVIAQERIQGKVLEYVLDL